MRWRLRPHRHRCEARTIAGKRCKSAPLSGTTRCLLHTPGGAQRLASLRWEQAKGSEEIAPPRPQSSARERPRPSSLPPRPLLARSHTQREFSPTRPTETPADRERARHEAHMAKKPAPEPVTVERARFAPYEQLAKLSQQLGSPAPGESQADWSIRRQLVMAEIWRRIQEHNGTEEAPTLPRLIHPDQYFM